VRNPPSRLRKGRLDLRYVLKQLSTGRLPPFSRKPQLCPKAFGLIEAGLLRLAGIISLI